MHKSSSAVVSPDLSSVFPERSSGYEMPREREERGDLFKMDDPFSVFQGIGGFGRLFGRRDPFADPFFSRPFGSLLNPGATGESATSGGMHGSNGEKGVLIEELFSDDEESEGKKESRINEHVMSGQEPHVEHPEDDADAERKIRNMNKRSDPNKVRGTQSKPQTFNYHTSKVTYGGVDGTYYTSSRTRRAGSDGVVVEESKEADMSTGQATHRISRGIHDKGHSVTRKLNSDGRVDTTQTLHNLNEDEISSFEEAWKGTNIRGQLPDWASIHGNSATGSMEHNPGVGREGWLPPSLEKPRNATTGGRGNGAGSNPSGSGAKKVVRINIE